MAYLGFENVIPFRQRGFVGTTMPRSGEPTFGDLAQEWLGVAAQTLARPRDAKAHVAHLAPLFATLEPGPGVPRHLELRPSVAARVLYGLSGSLGPKTINKVRGVGKQIIQWATLDDRWAGDNPFDAVKRLKQPKGTIGRSLTLEECRAMLAELKPPRRREAATMLYLGLRPGELKALRREDVDLGRRTVTIRRSNGRDQTKTGVVRVLPLLDGVEPYLGEALAESPADCRLVVPGADGGLQREDVKLSQILRSALRRAGIRGLETLRHYDLRHTAATLHREAGADPLAIQIALGHAPQNLTDSTYTHMTPERIRVELNKLKI